MNPHDFDADIQAVRAALVRLRDGDELLGINPFPDAQAEIDAIRRHHRSVRQALVSELIGFLDAREDIVDLQVRNGLDPLELLIGNDEEL
jgi:hypothetical protein